MFEPHRLHHNNLCEFIWNHNISQTYHAAHAPRPHLILVGFVVFGLTDRTDWHLRCSARVAAADIDVVVGAGVVVLLLLLLSCHIEPESCVKQFQKCFL